MKIIKKFYPLLLHYPKTGLPHCFFETHEFNPKKSTEIHLSLLQEKLSLLSFNAINKGIQQLQQKIQSCKELEQIQIFTQGIQILKQLRSEKTWATAKLHSKSTLQELNNLTLRPESDYSHLILIMHALFSESPNLEKKIHAEIAQYFFFLQPIPTLFERAQKKPSTLHKTTPPKKPPSSPKRHKIIEMEEIEEEKLPTPSIRTNESPVTLYETAINSFHFPKIAPHAITSPTKLAFHQLLIFQSAANARFNLSALQELKLCRLPISSSLIQRMKLIQSYCALELALKVFSSHLNSDRFFTGEKWSINSHDLEELAQSIVKTLQPSKNQKRKLLQTSKNGKRVLSQHTWFIPSGEALQGPTLTLCLSLISSIGKKVALENTKRLSPEAFRLAKALYQNQKKLQENLAPLPQLKSSFAEEFNNLKPSSSTKELLSFMKEFITHELTLRKHPRAYAVAAATIQINLLTLTLHTLLTPHPQYKTLTVKNDKGIETRKLIHCHDPLLLWQNLCTLDPSFKKQNLESILPHFRGDIRYPHSTSTPINSLLIEIDELSHFLNKDEFFTPTERKKLNRWFPGRTYNFNALLSTLLGEKLTEMKERTIYAIHLANKLSRCTM